MIKFKKIAFKIFMIICLLSVLIPVHLQVVYASGFSIQASSNSINVGGSANVTVNVSGLTGKFSVSGAVNDSFWSDGSVTKSYTVTGNSEGSLNVTVTASNVSDDDGNMINGSDSVSINVVKPAPTPSTPTPTPTPSTPSTPTSPSPTEPTPAKTPSSGSSDTSEVNKSSDSKLSALSISNGSLSPAFDSATTNYVVSLTSDIMSLEVTGVANDSNASLSGVGVHEVKPGENEIKIICTAEDGSSTTYLIMVNVDETPDTFVKYNNQNLGVVRNLEGVSPPETFEEITVIIEGKEVTAWKSNLYNLTIVYMVTEAGQKNFYLFDVEKQLITSIYKPIALLGKNLVIIDIPIELQSRARMKYQEVEVDGQMFMGWTFEDEEFSNYILLYVLDDKGKTQYYLYEKSENTLQLFSGMAAISQSNYEKEVADNEFNTTLRLWIIFGLVVTNVLTATLLILLLLKKKKSNQNHILFQGRNQLEGEINKIDPYKFSDDVSQDPYEHGFVERPLPNESASLFDSYEVTTDIPMSSDSETEDIYRNKE